MKAYVDVDVHDSAEHRLSTVARLDRQVVRVDLLAVERVARNLPTPAIDAEA